MSCTRPRLRHLLVVLVGMVTACTACTPIGGDPGSTTTSTSTSTTSTVAPPTSWEFSVKVVYPQAMVTRYGGEPALQTKIATQLHQVSAKFTGFSHQLKFIPVSYSLYSGDPNSQRLVPHPTANLLLIYTEDPTVNGGWDGANQALLHSWHPDPNASVGEAFAAYGTDGITHEFGHFRGAIDIYAQNVTNNPINGTTFDGAQSIMNYPYGETIWDAHSRCIIEKSGTTIGGSVSVVAQTLPSVYQVQVKTSAGVAVTGASITLYPVVWYSNTVSTTPAATGTTAASGIYQLTANPFHPQEDPTAPWQVKYSNFLVKAQKGTAVSYTYLPVALAGKADCDHHGDPLVMNLTVG